MAFDADAAADRQNSKSHQRLYLLHGAVHRQGRCLKGTAEPGRRITKPFLHPLGADMATKLTVNAFPAC